MSNEPDLDRVKPPEPPPLEQPDPQTAAEKKELTKRKPLTPVEREQLAHQEHLATLQRQIDHLQGEKQQLQEVINTLRGDLTESRSRCSNLQERCGRLEVISCFSGCMSLAGQLSTLAAGVLLGIAGAVSGLSDVLRTGFVWSGIAAAVGGVLFTICNFAASYWTKPGGVKPNGHG